MPEWPAAEVLLKLLVRQLAQKIHNEDGEAGAELRQLAISLLGSITAQVRLDAKRATEKHLFSAPAPKVRAVTLLPPFEVHYSSRYLL
jgi:hypothetical protein